MVARLPIGARMPFGAPSKTVVTATKKRREPSFGIGRTCGIHLGNKPRRNNGGGLLLIG